MMMLIHKNSGKATYLQEKITQETTSVRNIKEMDRKIRTQLEKP